MKKILNIFLAAATVATLGACSKEDPFGNEEPTQYGQFRTDALRVELQNESGIPDVFNRPTRAGAPDVENFKVDFIKEGAEDPESSYLYSQMPEVVTLPVGSYTVRASYGENLPAAWENPYYKGESTFSVEADEITESIDPIVCSLSNVRVSIAFDKGLLDNMGDDAKVTVKIGDTGSLDYTKEDTEKSGYFAYVEESHTLAATFNGTVEGYPSSETKAYDNVQPGMHYRITFRLHQAGEEDPGEINGTLNVDASVEVVDMNQDIIPDDDIIEDDMRPIEGNDEPTPGPGPNDPVTTPPALTAKAPLSFDTPNIITDDMECVFYLHSEFGIDELKVVIDSDTLDHTELSNVGLTDKLDLVNPGEFAEALSGLGFPINVKGEKDLEFNLTQFMPLLKVLGAGDSSFILTIKDAGGTTVKTLTLTVK
ncbi:MAG: DUF4493 domain-containing protein [Prevotella sp.]|nr:DUF4493 domain-containing protein [Prevotella sp.]